MLVGIIGLGEVGTAIKRLCKKKHHVFGRTRSQDELKGKQVDILHLCYPYTDKFVDVAIKNIKELKPKLVINNSSVKPGTTWEIFKQTKVPIVHAPIIGKHPHLYRYLFKMEKIIGPVNQAAYRMAKHHFEELGLTTTRFRSPKESEMAKVLSTTYYGWNIIFEKFVYRMCKDQNVSYKQVYGRLNQIYNQGYGETLPQVRRPILKHQEGSIGGHCVVPNARIIRSWMKDEFTEFLLKQNEKAKKDNE
jgi:UDP-N-acetyl-D-mannosaminuronate dehydrogenase